MVEEDYNPEGRRLNIPAYVPEHFAHAVATVLLLGIAGGDQWDLIFDQPPEKSLAWIMGILNANELTGLVHSEIEWWEHQIQGH
jgi:hypothetical protein